MSDFVFTFKENNVIMIKTHSVYRGKVMTNKNAKNDKIVSAFLVVAIVTVMIVSYIVALGKFDDDVDYTSQVVSEEESSEVVVETSETSEEEQTEKPSGEYYDTLSFETVQFPNSEVVNGALAVLPNNPNGCAKVNEDTLVNISQYMTQNVYGLSTVALEIKEEAMSSLDDFIVSFYQEVPKNGLIIVNSYMTPEKISSTNSMPELSSGYSVQFSIYQSSYSFSDVEFSYLRDQAHRYGMIQRYPSGKETYTGVDSNSSIYRYVGLAHSWYMNYYKYCLEEYVDKIKTEKVIEYDSEIEKDVAYVIYYVPASTDSGSTMVTVPTNCEDYTVSGDGKDGFIVTARIKKS